MTDNKLCKYEFYTPKLPGIINRMVLSVINVRIRDNNAKHESERPKHGHFSSRLRRRGLGDIVRIDQTHPFYIQVSPSTQSLATTTVVSHRAPLNKTQITPKRVSQQTERVYLLSRQPRAD